MRVVLAALADCANVTGTGKVNIMGVFSTVFAAQTPVRLLQCYLAIVLRAEEDEKGTSQPFQIVLRDAESRPVFSSPPGTTFEVPQMPAEVKADVSLVIGMPGLPFPKFGDYELEFISGELRHAISVVVQPIIQSGQGHVA